LQVAGIFHLPFLRRNKKTETMRQERLFKVGSIVNR